MGKRVLITGGSGSVGMHLSNLLLSKGYEVVHLSRSTANLPHIKTYLWDVEKKEIDENSFSGVDVIVHLAGAGIADSHWTDERKQLIINSRTQSIQLIYQLLKTLPHQVKTVVSASASGFYSDRGDELMTETAHQNTDFLGQCCVLWEQAVDAGKDLDLRIVKFRTGVILDKNHGALPKIAAPIKLGFGAPLGNGHQWISWLHLEDVSAMYLYAIENENLNGTYNMSTAQPLTNKELTQAIAKKLKKPLWLPHVPAFLLKLIFGEMSTVVLGSTKMDVNKIEQTGFKFQFSNIIAALNNIYG